jgi:hypothetical protein
MDHHVGCFRMVLSIVLVNVLHVGMFSGWLKTSQLLVFAIITLQ